MSASFPGEMVITVGAGRTQPRGHRVTIRGGDPLRGLAQRLGDLPPFPESWWCGSSFRGDHRREDRWERSSLLGVDIDYRDDEGRHAAVPGAFRERFERWQPSLPGSLAHPTPRGHRVCFLLERAVGEIGAWRAAARGAVTLVHSSLEAGALTHEVGRGRAGLSVDQGASTDPARLWWAPRTEVNGERRDARVVVLNAAPYITMTLAHLGRGAGRTPPRPAPVRIREDGASRYGLAVLRHACERVEGAVEGERHPTLRCRARLVAGYVAGGEIEESLARDCLLSAALGSGLPEREARRLIEWAFDRGVEHPLAAPRWGVRR